MHYAIGKFDSWRYFILGCLHNQCHQNHLAGGRRLSHLLTFFDFIRVTAFDDSLDFSRQEFTQGYQRLQYGHEEAYLDATNHMQLECQAHSRSLLRRLPQWLNYFLTNRSPQPLGWVFFSPSPFSPCSPLSFRFCVTSQLYTLAVATSRV